MPILERIFWKKQRVPKIDRYFIFFCLVCLGFNSYGQKFTADIGAGLGWASAIDDTRLPSGVTKTPLRGLLHAGINYHISSNVLLGFEANTSFFIDPTVLLLLSSDEANANEDGTIIMDPLNYNAHNLVLKGAHYFDYKGFRPYLALGTGLHFNVQLLDFFVDGERQRQTTTNFVLMPEIGVEIGDFTVALRSVIGGKTDAFAGINEREENVRLEQNRFFVFYLKGSYRFKL